jgi:hypothetical protein
VLRLRYAYSLDAATDEIRPPPDAGGVAGVRCWIHGTAGARD